MELLSVGPFCMVETGAFDDEGLPTHTVHYCSPNATRTQRSGVTDVEYMIRPDREYWLVCFDSNPTRAHARTRALHRPLALRSEFKFARQRLAGESGDDIELCRANLTARIAKCHLNCDACGAHCTSKAVREIASVAKCTIALPILGMLQALHSSDLGTVRKLLMQTSQRAPRPTCTEARIPFAPQDIGYRWGAVRHSNRPANPTESWEEKYRTLVQNSVSNPMAPRNSLSCRCARPRAPGLRARAQCPTPLVCRKPHHESSVGSFHPPLDEEGVAVERKGFHVPCNTDLDCFSRCGSALQFKHLTQRLAI